MMPRGVSGNRSRTSPLIFDSSIVAVPPSMTRLMFGEVADSTRQLTSHYTTRNDVQAILDFPFQEAARSFASRSRAIVVTSPGR